MLSQQSCERNKISTETQTFLIHKEERTRTVIMDKKYGTTPQSLLCLSLVVKNLPKHSKLTWRQLYYIRTVITIFLLNDSFVIHC